MSRVISVLIDLLGILIISQCFFEVIVGGVKQLFTYFKIVVQQSSVVLESISLLVMSSRNAELKETSKWLFKKDAKM